jgi:hypothetical protein
LLVYLLAKQLSSPAGGLVAAALGTLLGYSAMSKLALNIDAPLLMIYLLALLTLQGPLGATVVCLPCFPVCFSGLQY